MMQIRKSLEISNIITRKESRWLYISCTFLASCLIVSGAVLSCHRETGDGSFGTHLPSLTPAASAPDPARRPINVDLHFPGPLPAADCQFPAANGQLLQVPGERSFLLALPRHPGMPHRVFLVGPPSPGVALITSTEALLA